MSELKKQIKRYNDNMDSTMFLGTLVRGYYRLFINEVEITDGDYEDILERVKGINRENGLQWL